MPFDQLSHGRNDGLVKPHQVEQHEGGDHERGDAVVRHLVGALVRGELGLLHRLPDHPYQRRHPVVHPAVVVDANSHLHARPVCVCVKFHVLNYIYVTHC